MPFMLVCALGVLLDPWNLQPDLTANAKSNWSVSIDALINGAHQNATARLTETITGPANASGLVPAHMEVGDIEGENGQAVPDGVADGLINAQNVIQSTKDEDDDRRMFSPTFFVYPTKPVNLGDSWTVDVKPSAAGALKMTYSFTAKSVEQENGNDLLLVTSIVKEDSSDGLDSTGQWWLSKDGHVVRFRVDMKRWHITMLGGLTLDAVVTGQAKH